MTAWNNLSYNTISTGIMSKIKNDIERIKKTDPESAEGIEEGYKESETGKQRLLGLKRGELRVSPYKEEWKNLFEIEKKNIEEAIGDDIKDIQHVGSTSIPGMPAKPILDIAIAVKDFEEARICIKPLCNMGYTFKGENGIPRRHYFLKGESCTHHIHLLEKDSEEWEKLILFRDYLRTHQNTAEEYKKLKRNLSEKLQGDRKAYQAAKTDFVEAVIRKSPGSRLKHAP